MNLIAFGTASILVTPLFLLLGTSGAKYGLPWVMLARTAFGIRGSIVIGLFRGIVAVITSGVMMYHGGLSLYAAFVRVTDQFNMATPLNNLTVGFLIMIGAFWILSTLCALLGAKSIRHLIYIQCIVVCLLAATTLSYLSIQLKDVGFALSDASFVANHFDLSKATLFVMVVGFYFGFWVSKH